MIGGRVEFISVFIREGENLLKNCNVCIDNLYII